MSNAFECDICKKLTTQEPIKIDIRAPKKWWELHDEKVSFSDICKQCGDDLCKFLKVKLHGVSYLP